VVKEYAEGDGGNWLGFCSARKDIGRWDLRVALLGERSGRAGIGKGTDGEGNESVDGDCSGGKSSD
jgi:hypothetical protein